MVIAIALGSACSAWGQTTTDLAIGDPSRRDRNVALEVDAATDTRTGEVLSFDQVAARLDGVGIVLVGEDHNSMEAHRVQLGIVRALHARGRNVGVGFEMLPATAQPALDRWSTGRVGEAEFLDSVDWYEAWGMHWGYYRDLFVFARDQHLPVFGLNVPRRVIRAVGRGTEAELPADLVALLPECVDTSSDDHRTLIRAYFGGDSDLHGGMDDEQFEAMYTAQATWDAAMGYQAVHALNSISGEGSVLVVLAGSGHVAYGLGISRQAAAWTQRRFATIVPVPVGQADDETIPAVRASYADFVWGLPPETEPAYPNLGLSTSDADPAAGDQRRRVVYVMEGTAAHAAGIQVGDLLLFMDGEPVPDRRTFNRRMAEKQWGDRVSLRIQRQDEALEFDLLLRRASQTEPATDDEPQE
ncbi:MAG: ChaN family lipoprotein [Thermoanaerobaculia bacterium]|nr:ChaN family lipoprotein [Thermoanaerobaculia bacterium]